MASKSVREVFAHPIGRDAIEKSAVGHKGDHSFFADAVRGPANRLSHTDRQERSC